MKKYTKPFTLLIILFISANCSFFPDNEVIYPFDQQKEDGLPVFYLHPAPRGDAYTPVTLYYKGKEYNVEAKIRGATSYGYPMKSYAIRFTENSLFSDPDYGFYNRRKILLLTSFDDNSFIRTRLAFDLWNHMSPDHIQVKTFNAVTYLDGKYHGLYTVCDSVDRALMEANGLAGTGNLYKAVAKGATFRPGKNLFKNFERKESSPESGFEDIFSDLRELINFLDKASDEEFLASVDTFLNRQEYQDWWIFGLFILAADSMEKNAYHYHDLEAEQWRFIPWDFNASFGQAWDTRRNGYAVYSEYRKNRIIERFFLEPVTRDELFSRYYDFLIPGGALDINWILCTIDSYYNEIHDGAVKSELKWRNEHRNCKRWSDRNDFTNFEEEISYIKWWLSERHNVLLDRFN